MAIHLQRCYYYLFVLIDILLYQVTVYEIIYIFNMDVSKPLVVYLGKSRNYSGNLSQETTISLYICAAQ